MLKISFLLLITILVSHTAFAAGQLKMPGYEDTKKELGTKSNLLQKRKGVRGLGYQTPPDVQAEICGSNKVVNGSCSGDHVVINDQDCIQDKCQCEDPSGNIFTAGGTPRSCVERIPDGPLEIKEQPGSY